MLVLTQGEDAENIIVTLNEKKTIGSPYYLFVFTNSATKNIVTWIVNSALDQSDYPERFNKFEIPTASLFDTKNDGYWLYNVYEQESSTNTDTTGLTEVENGKMKLNKSTQFSYNGYEPTTEYKGYRG